MGLFSAAFKAECQKGVSLPGGPEIYPILELVLPSGTRRYSKAGVASAARGFSEPRILRWGQVSRSIDLRGTNIQAMEVTPELSDIPDDGSTERTFSTEVARYPRSLRGSLATIRLVSPNVPDADHFIAFQGQLRSWDQTGPMTWALKLGNDDAALEFGQVPKATIQPVDRPLAHPSAFGTFIPIVYGIHNSDGISPRAMLPAYYVDTVNFLYEFQLGRSSQVRAVFKDGVVVPTTDYTVTYSTGNGKLAALIDFTADPWGGGEPGVITVDADGLTYNSDGTGGLITNPADQLLHFLNNFVWGDWRSGPFQGANAPVNAASFDAVADFLDAMGHEGSRWLGGVANEEGVASSTDALQILKEWLTSHECRAFWTNSSELAIGVNDHRTTDIYIDDPHLQGNEDEQGAFGTPFDQQALLREITLQYVFGAAAGKYHQTVRVQDLSVVDPIARTLQLPWSAARVV
jgi:hypothetical protein